MNSNVNIAEQLVRIAALSVKAAQIAAARAEFVGSDKAILDALEAAFIAQEAQELLKGVIESSTLVEGEDSD